MTTEQEDIEGAKLKTFLVTLLSPNSGHWPHTVIGRGKTTIQNTEAEAIHEVADEFGVAHALLEAKPLVPDSLTKKRRREIVRIRRRVVPNC